MKITPDTGWKKLPQGGVILEAGNAEQYITGSWRTFRPIRDEQKCTNCLLCWIHCPDSSIIVENAKIVGIDYDHCKGCGVCAEVCPPRIKAITMVEERKTDDLK